MRILALDAALARCSVAVLAGDTVLAQEAAPGGRGQPALLAPMVQRVLAASGLAAPAMDGIAVTVGPGSFAGLRSAIALAQGLALAAGTPVLGVRVAEALAETIRLPPGRCLWVAIDSRRNRVFLDRDGAIAPVALTDLPRPAGPVALAGDAAIEVACRLAARGADVMLTDARLPDAVAVARVGARRLAGTLPPLAAQPLYIDPPEAKLPAGGLRPAPRGMIERAGPAHAEALAAIHHAAFPPGQRWGADAMVLQLELPGVFVLFDPRGAMVMARVTADEAEILTLAVMPSQRRQGLARTLLEAATRDAAALGAATLFLEVATRNDAARALYESAGFAQVGLRRRYYADGDDALVLRRSLTPAPADPR